MDKLNSVGMPTNCVICPILSVQTSILSVDRRVDPLLRYCKIYSFYFGHWCDVSTVCRQLNRNFLEWNWYHNIWEITMTTTTMMMLMMRLMLMSTHCSLWPHSVNYQFYAWRSPPPDKMHDISHRHHASIEVWREPGRWRQTIERFPMVCKLQECRTNEIFVFQYWAILTWCLPNSNRTPRNDTHEYKNGKWQEPKSVASEKELQLNFILHPTNVVFILSNVRRPLFSG